MLFLLTLSQGKTSAVGQAVPAELDVYVDKRRTNDLLGSETNMEGLPLSEMYDEEHKAWKTNTVGPFSLSPSLPDGVHRYRYIYRGLNRQGIKPRWPQHDDCFIKHSYNRFTSRYYID